MDNQDKIKVLSMISGKGGSGKTCVSLAIAQFLAILGKSILLIDLDTSTHGASYFFESDPPGLEEWVLQYKVKFAHILEDETEKETASKKLMECIRPSKDKPVFNFLPSKTKFEMTDWEVDHVSEGINAVAEYIKQVINTHEFEYIILDCQAGVNEVTSSALKLSTHAIIVTEADSISTKALKNLQYQFSHVFPNHTIALINKLFLEEKTTYDQLTSILRGLDFLPPIPFDMDVRDAFARGIIPLEQKHPTAYFSAVMRILQELFSELRKEINILSDDIKHKEFGDYKHELNKASEEINELKVEKENIIDEIARHKELSERRRRMLIPLAIILISTFPIFSGFLPNIFADFSWELYIAVFGTSLAYIWIFFDIYIRKHRKKKEHEEDRLFQIDNEIKKIEENIDKYNTLYLTERKKILL